MNLVPLPSAYTDDGRALSEIRIARSVKYLRENGAEGFYLCGETGEFAVLSASERKMMLEVVQRECQSACAIVVNVSSLSTSLSLDLAQHASRHGARAVLLTPPFFGSFSPSEQLSHFKSVASFGNIPVLFADPFLSLAPGFEFPNVGKTVEATGMDCWAGDQFGSSAIASYSKIFGIAEAEFEKLAVAFSTPAVVKACFDFIGIEVGAPRSPRQTLDAGMVAHLVTTQAA